MFRLPIEYDPTHPYSRQELIELIEPHVPLLCFFATIGRGRRCVVGLNFDDYDPASRSISVLIIPPEAVRNVLMPVHGKRFRRAYRASRVGRSILVTFSAPQGAGWFRADWRLDEAAVLAGGSDRGYP